MKSVFSILLWLLLHFGYSHDIKMAIFEIYAGKSGLEMMVSLDREDFLSTLSQEFGSEITSENLEAHAFEYLQCKIAIQVNGECTSFTINKIKLSDFNIHLQGSLNISVSEVTEIRMTNTCMVDLIPDQDNIMKLKLNDRIRSFRLNSNRTSTTAIY
ncbi:MULTISPECIES: DUF6702 family protein [unclassified Ekhidna]|jgi:hypothetical protein|uniref:DUF6702 family protein n=1 Tax=unclassified Ekhidna TaxID=2632188 RepID=UPI0032DF174D